MAQSSAAMIVWIVLHYVAYTLAYECPRDSAHCVTSLDIGYDFTMYNEEYGHLISKDRKLFLSSNLSVQLPSSVTVNTADGYPSPRKLILANGTFPGPPIVLYQNQKITVIVKNNLLNEGVSIHWHGIDQTTSPFMDGVSFVTQCPISPGQSFNYTFQPRYGGTFWYHSHIGTQRDYGLFGAFIVLRTTESQSDIGHALIVSEWNHDHDPTTAFVLGSDPHSVLINGKGEFENNGAPLEVISVGSGNSERFRLIHAGSAQPLTVWIQDHQLHVIETDGFPVERTTVDRIMIHPGERYDFIVDIGNTGNYNISVNVPEENHMTFGSVSGLALLSVNQDKTPPTVSTSGNKIKILNCPFLVYSKRAKF